MAFFRLIEDELDYYSEQDRYVVRFDMPGVEPTNINITRKGRMVSIEGKRYHRLDPNKVERAYRKSFTTPLNCGQIHASYSNGVVYVFVEKPLQEEPEKIHLSYESPDGHQFELK